MAVRVFGSAKYFTSKLRFRYINILRFTALDEAEGCNEFYRESRICFAQPLGKTLFRGKSNSHPEAKPTNYTGVCTKVAI